MARAQLVDMRAQVIAQLDRKIDGGVLALLGTIQVAIWAIDAAAEESEAAARVGSAD
jgi:hypothetical protein